MKIDAHPVLSCSASTEYEKAFFSSGQETEDILMYRAGRAIAAAVEDDFEEISGFPAQGKAVILAGKGHNAGDALICANTLLDRHPDLEVMVLLAFPVDSLRKNVRAPYELLRVRSEIHCIEEGDEITPLLKKFSRGRCIDLCIDGIFGMQCRPPLRGSPLAIIQAVNEFEHIRLRAAVDLPSGIGDESDPNAFEADFTYSTGIAKVPVVEDRSIAKVGRLRYLDLGFFQPRPDLKPEMCILRQNILWQLASFREPATYKRTYGHLLVLAGSDSMPGACLMATMAAANSGCGLLTVGTLESVARAGIPLQPEAMWKAIPSIEGTLHDGILEEVESRFDDFSCILIGPGLGRTQGVQDLVKKVIETVDKPIVVDADALVPDLQEHLQARPKEFSPVVLTPHPGEWKRIGGETFEDSGASSLTQFCQRNRCIVILKGPRTRIANAFNVYLSPFGGPVLARGGTGDLLAGMVSSLLSQDPKNPTSAATLATVWHGRAADCLARARGNWAVRTTLLLDFLPEALGFKH
ncbi:NAD(P)H-hydrate dehydratase [Puniceicoccus vermicola]|uniref:ADP-dependent (S)-NAD(P)H-hydrate dehydratase n=1 Tax=Puniceicoccus vermicola TaxID=388746 RepID=A0A7X1B067_9BACT|nr:NAD(P)H-hydrate dehydratase [Puniceicoccus vermicola]